MLEHGLIQLFKLPLIRLLSRNGTRTTFVAESLILGVDNEPAVF